jgi:hypothetical protein
MRRLARWCITHRRRVVTAWVAVAILTTVAAHLIGPNYVTVPRVNVEGSVAEGPAEPEAHTVEPPSAFAPSP